MHVHAKHPLLAYSMANRVIYKGEIKKRKRKKIYINVQENGLKLLQYNVTKFGYLSRIRSHVTLRLPVHQHHRESNVKSHTF